MSKSSGVSLGVSAKFFLLLSFLLALAAVVGGGYLYYAGLQSFKQADIRLNSIAQMTSSQAMQLQNSTTSLNDKIDSITARVDKLSINHTGIVMYQVNQLIAMANEAIVVYGNIANGIQLLTYTEDALASDVVDHAQFAGLSYAISKDINALKQINVINTAKVAGQIDALVNLIPSLPVIDKSVGCSGEHCGIGTKTTNLNAWNKFYLNFKNTLFSIIQVSKSNTGFGMYLLPEQEILVQQNIKLDLLSARIALFQHSQTEWQGSLNNALNILKMYFVKSNTTDNFSNGITEMLNINVATSKINIDDTLSALNQLNNIVTK